MSDPETTSEVGVPKDSTDSPRDTAGHDLALLGLRDQAGPLGPGDLVALLRADQLCRWQRGERVPAESYLRYFPSLRADVAAATDLIYQEFLLRRGLGEAPEAEGYLRRFPQLEAQLRDRFSQAPPPTVPSDPPGEGLPPPSVDGAAAHGYEVLRELGRGGMGVVYEARDRRRQREVALKVMRQTDAAALYRFKQEFRALADISHTNLVTLYELVSDGRQWFIVMELVRGVDFITHVRGGRAEPDLSSTVPLGPPGAAPAGEVTPAEGVGRAAPEGRLRAALRQLVEGTLALHEAGKLHRDIKPTNVLVTAEGRVVLLDFGLAVELDASGVHHTEELHASGTIPYMSPEQADGLPITPASDWYSVGVMLYRALTGRLPFAGSAAAVLLAKRREDPPPPAQLVPDVPADLNALCLDLLCRRPEGRPPGRDILRRLGSHGPGAAPAPHAPHSPFVGRERHLAALHEALAAVRGGRAVTVHLHGRSGLGKSELLQRFLHELRERGEAVVLAGRCYERESVPFKALDSLVDALTRFLMQMPRRAAEALLPPDVHALARVFPVLRQVGAIAALPPHAAETPDRQELRARAFAALRELLARLAAGRPLVLCIDDLQWGDADSATLLADLLRPPDPPTLLLLVSYRSEYAATSPCLHALRAAPAAPGEAVDRRELAVEPLVAEEALRLALALTGRDDPEARARAEAAARESQGSPYFLRELVLTEDLPAERVTLDEVLGRRVAGLAEGARRLLEVVAVSGRPLCLADACRAAELDADERQVLAALNAGRLLRSMGPGEQGEVETYHDRIREVVTAHLPADRLCACHRRLAVTLEAGGAADPEALAIHFEGGGEPGRAGHYYAAAADRAAEALAFDRAAGLFRRAAELRPGGEAEARRLRVRLADALANAGRGGEAAREYEAACAGAAPDEARELRRRGAYQYCVSGHLDEGRRALAAVLADVGMSLPGSPRHALLRLLLGRLRLWLRGLDFRECPAAAVDPAALARIDVSWSASAGLSLFDFVGAAGLQAENLLLALKTGEPYRVARALAWEAAHISNTGGPAWPRTARLLEAADALAGRLDQPHARGMAALAREAAAFTSGRWKDVAPHRDRAEQIFRDHCTGVAWELDTVQVFGLWALFYEGELAEMGRRAALLLEEARRRGDLYAATVIGTFAAPMARLAAGEPGEARRLLEEALAGWATKGFHLPHLTALMCRTYIDLYEGAGAAAWQRLTQQWPAVVGSHFLRAQMLRILLGDLRARTALAAAAASEAPGPWLRAAVYGARHIEREKMPWARPIAEMLYAGVAACRGNTPAAAARLELAAAGFTDADMAVFAAAARRRQGELLGGEAGQALIAAADAALAGQGVREPACFAAAFTPWPAAR